MNIHELATALPIILSLIILEGLLSVDNAMAIAAMASTLPKHQQKAALRLGIIGAYLFRGIALLLAAWIASNHIVKLIGAMYLLYLMCNQLSIEKDEGEDAKNKVAKNFILTVVQIEIMDLSLSFDNVVAAVALDSRLWVICTGVFIGILILRFVAGFCISLIEKFPILEKTAFLLVGFIGITLIIELWGEHNGMNIEISGYQKFAGIIIITVISLLYAQSELGRKCLTPLVVIGKPIIYFANQLTALPISWVKKSID